MKQKRGVTYKQFQSMALALPGVEAGTSFGTPSVRVKGKFMARLREEDVLVLTAIDDMEKEFLFDTQPETYFTTDHYRGHPTVLIRLSKVHAEDLRGLLERSWQGLAPKKLVAARDQTSSQ